MILFLLFLVFVFAPPSMLEEQFGNLGRVRVLLALCLYAYLLTHIERSVPLELFFRSRVFIACMAFTLVDLLSRIIFNWDSNSTWQTAKLDVTLLSVGLWTYMIFSESQIIRKLPWLIVILVTLVSAISLVDDFIRQPVAARFTAGFGEQRLDPNDTAYVICWGVVTAMFLFWQKVSKVRKLLLAGATVFMMGSLLLTGSRGGFLVLFVVVFMYVVSTRNIKFIIIVTALWSLSLALVLAYPDLLPQSQRSVSMFRFSTLDDFLELDSNLSRLPAQRAALVAWLNNPIYGIGGGRFVTDGRHYFDIQTLFIGIGPHNSYLLTMAELGIIGFCCYIWWLISLYKGIRRHRAYGLAAPLITGIVAGFFTTCVPSWHIMFVLTGVVARLDALAVIAAHDH